MSLHEWMKHRDRLAQALDRIEALIEHAEVDSDNGMAIHADLGDLLDVVSMARLHGVQSSHIGRTYGCMEDALIAQVQITLNDSDLFMRMPLPGRDGHAQETIMEGQSRWLGALYDRVCAIAMARVNSYDRAPCPLCGATPTGGWRRMLDALAVQTGEYTYTDDDRSGWRVPEGLRRHLSGRGSAQRCVVTEAIEALMLRQRVAR